VGELGGCGGVVVGGGGGPGGLGLHRAVRGSCGSVETTGVVQEEAVLGLKTRGWIGGIRSCGVDKILDRPVVGGGGSGLSCILPGVRGGGGVGGKVVQPRGVGLAVQLVGGAGVGD